MKRQELAKAFDILGRLMSNLSQEKDWPGFGCGVTADEYADLQMLINRQVHHNGWFTPQAVRRSFAGIAKWLKERDLLDWSDYYDWNENSKSVALIMAGNIPLVGFHDLLCVVFSGNKAVCKLSSDDKQLLPALINVLYSLNDEFKEIIKISPMKLEGFDAVIATGSTNSLIYFEQYFGKYPHIFRKNRTSIAILNGEETDDELKALGADIFTFFGLGCRNVTFVFIPMDFELNRFFENIIEFADVVNHNKYANNYDYNKAVYLLNKFPLLDNNFVLLREAKELFSPLAMLHYHRYENREEVDSFLTEFKEDIQVVVAQDRIPFGMAQEPGLSDYADNVDTMKWLAHL